MKKHLLLLPALLFACTRTETEKVTQKTTGIQPDTTAVAVVAPVTPAAPASRPAAVAATADVVAAFEQQKSANGNLYSVTSDGATQELTVLPGAFTASGATEGIVNLTDAAQSQADSPSEVWLLRRVGAKWQPVRRLEEGCATEATVLDVDGDSRLEVQTVSSCEGQGHAESTTRVLSLAGGKVTPLLVLPGHDYTGRLEDGDVFLSHTLSVSAPGQLTDVQIRKKYKGGAQARETSDFSRYQLTDSTATRVTYRLVSGKWQPDNDLKARK